MKVQYYFFESSFLPFVWEVLFYLKSVVSIIIIITINNIVLMIKIGIIWHQFKIWPRLYFLLQVNTRIWHYPHTPLFSECPKLLPDWTNVIIVGFQIALHTPTTRTFYTSLYWYQCEVILLMILHNYHNCLSFFEIYLWLFLKHLFFINTENSHFAFKSTDHS